VEAGTAFEFKADQIHPGNPANGAHEEIRTEYWRAGWKKAFRAGCVRNSANNAKRRIRRGMNGRMRGDSWSWRKDFGNATEQGVRKKPKTLSATFPPIQEIELG